MKISACGVSDVGRKREKNEDSILVDEEFGVYMVADGMGGHLGGEFASRLTVETVRNIFHDLDEDPETTLVGDEEYAVNDLGERMRYAIRMASVRVFEEATQNSHLSGMGTTAVGLVISEGKAYICNVGDSRAYLVRNDTIVQLTEDHSLVSEQVRAGFITEEYARHHRLKNIITRSVGYQKDVEADLLVRDLEDDDTFLLCSDGLTNLVDNEALLKVIKKNKDLKKACDKLVASANSHGGDDNISVILVRVEKDE
jgi:PPM family protein phosphatase